MLLYQGQVVRLEWQSPHACEKRIRVWAASQEGSPVTGGLECEWPYGMSWISAKSAIAASPTHRRILRHPRLLERISLGGDACPPPAAGVAPPSPICPSSAPTAPPLLGPADVTLPSVTRHAHPGWR